MKMQKDILVRVFDIQWDTMEDGEFVDVSLPDDIIIDHDFDSSNYIEDNGELDTDSLLDEVSDYLSDVYGFLHDGFCSEIYVKDMEGKNGTTYKVYCNSQAVDN